MISDPHFDSEHATIWHGDCIDVMRGLPDASIDACVTDPPYDLTAGKKGGTGAASINLDSPYGRSRIGTGNGSGGFMGKAWDSTGIAFEVATWAEVYRVLKPGGWVLSFGGTRTFHRMAVAIEDAGFEIRDSIAWLYGSGFPKSLDVSKAIDKAAGAEREVVGYDAAKARPNKVKFAKLPEGHASEGSLAGVQDNGATVTAPSTAAARDWQGWGTALKPAFEPVVVARKPLAGTVAANVLAHGTGALNIDASRIAHRSEADLAESVGKNRHADFGTAPGGNAVYGDFSMVESKNYDGAAGRWPANVILDESQAAALDQQSGVQRDGVAVNRNHAPGSEKPGTIGPLGLRNQTQDITYGGAGGASRFFYTAKASTDERPSVAGIAHPTVKPLDLMRWLVRLVTPKGGVVLEPFAGSGTTVEAAVLEGFRCIAIEREADYLPLIMQRVSKPHAIGLDFDWEDAS